MACGLSKSLCLSSSLKMQGITTILGSSDCDISLNTSSASSLRRTFSADLSSKNWLSNNGISPMKRVSSSEKLCTFDTNSISFSDEEEIKDEEKGLRSGSDIWAQIQQDKNKKKMERPAQSDVWGSILTEKKAADSNTTIDSPPYVHPLMKRASSLSEKSLEICTESLGSETGCEGFSSEIDNEINNQEEIKEEIMAPKLGQGSFPPPIPSLSTQSGSSLHMKTRRHDGRLVMEAVSMPSHTNFNAMRENGRLLLTFAESDKEIDSEEEDITDSDEEIENIHNFDDHKNNEFQNLHRFVQKPIGPVTVHRLAHKPIGVPKRNSKLPETDEIDNKTIAQSLPPRPRVAQLFRSMKPPSTVDDTVGAACFNNTCDYYWKPTKEIEQTKTKTQFHNLVNKSEGWLNGCKEQRRSLLSLEPFCIAT